MEIEDSNIKCNLLENNYFQILYPNQKYKLSSEYKQWKKTIEEKIGKNGIEIFCKKDNIIIYQKFENINDIIKCPICDENIYQCQYCNKKRVKKTSRCCLKAYIKELKEKEQFYQYLEIDENKKKSKRILSNIFYKFFTYVYCTSNFFNFFIIFIFES